MTTSIRQLLQHVTERQLLHYRAGDADPEAASDARLVIGAAADVLGKLDNWRPDWTPRHAARQLTTQLQTACAAVQAGNHPYPNSRSHALMAITADAVGTLYGSTSSAADRWNLTLAVADAIRHATSVYYTNGPELADPAIATVRTAAIDIARTGLRTPPRRLHRSLVDVPIPGGFSDLPDPLRQAAVAAAVIDHHLARAATDDAHGPVSLYELRSLALAFEHTVIRAGTAFTTSAHDPATAWSHVRQLARLLHDGQRPASDAPEILVRKAAQLHHDLDRSGATPLDAVDRLVLSEILVHVANSADSLVHHIPHLSGQVYARADQFPTLEARASQQLRHEPFIANVEDLAILQAALRVAERTTLRLAECEGSNLALAPYPLIAPAPVMPITASPSIGPPR